jgi:hypothetical protein
MAGRGGEGGGMDAANLFKRSSLGFKREATCTDLIAALLARGKLRCIGATTLAEYRKYIEKDAALERRFAQVLVNEPSVPETISILRGIREKYEVHHGVSSYFRPRRRAVAHTLPQVRIHDGALIAAATLSDKYLPARKLPDKAVDLGTSPRAPAPPAPPDPPRSRRGVRLRPRHARDVARRDRQARAAQARARGRDPRARAREGPGVRGPPPYCAQGNRGRRGQAHAAPRRVRGREAPRGRGYEPPPEDRRAQGQGGRGRAPLRPRDRERPPLLRPAGCRP